MFLQYFDCIHYHSNRNFKVRVEKNEVHNQHIATCSHIKFQQTGLNSF